MLFRKITTVVSSVVIVLVVMGAGASSALAENHPFLSSFGAFSNPNGIAVDEPSGDVYVADIGTGTVQKFDANGSPVEFSTLKSNTLTGGATPAKSFSFPAVYGNPAAIAVDNSSSPSDPSKGDLYVMDAGHKVIDKFNPDGEFLHAITGPTPDTFSEVVGIAVDANGNVLINEDGGFGHEGVREFDDSKENIYLTHTVHGPPSERGFAVGPADDIYVLQGCDCVEKFTPNPGENLGQVDDGSTGVALAVDHVTGHVYIDEQSSVAEWDSGEMKNFKINGSIPEGTRGTLVSSFGSLQLSGSVGEGGIAVNGATGEVYVSNPADGKVYVFGTAAPGVSVSAPAGVSETAATLQGTVNPRGAPVTSCVFEYGTTGAYGQSVACAQSPGQIGSGASPVSVSADIAGLQPGVLYHFRLEAGNASGKGLSTGLFSTVGSGFGIKGFEVALTNKDGSPDTQAGSHPYEMSTSLEFNTTIDSRDFTEPDGNLKDLIVNLPPGLIGNPNATVKCTIQQLEGEKLEQESEEGAGCPAPSQIGVLSLEFGSNKSPLIEPVYNMVPPAGVAVQFGAHFLIPEAFIDVGVPAGGDYGVRATVTNPSALQPLIGSRLTVWGVPQEAGHDGERLCPNHEHPCPDGEPVKPFLTLPTACSGPLTSTVSADSYQEPGRFVDGPPSVTHDSSGSLLAVTGCSKLHFPPSIGVSPDVPDASSSTGLTVGVRVPQTAALNPEGLAESTLRDTTVALPAGVAINPAGADGLEACSEGLAGFEIGRGVNGSGFEEFNPDFEPGVQTPLFTSTSPELLQPGVSFCPDGSKIGTVKIKTPLLPDPLEGAVYLAAQEANPFGGLLGMYLIAEDPVSGTLIKLPGEVRVCEGAGEVIAGDTCEGVGQIVTTFKNTPELPFEELELHFFGGERAPLSTPSHCGSYTTRASFTPWDGNGPVDTSSSFQITSGPNGSPCPGARLPFNPTVTGGATNIQAGAFSPLTVTVSRKDGEQNLKSIVAKLPPGLSGVLAGVELCPEPRANEGLCGENSKVGEATVSVGVGGHPFTVSGGKFYLTGPYNGSGGCTVGEAGCAPFGLTFEVPAKAGPFDLANTKNNHPPCDCVVVRGKIELNPLTSAITITTNPPGSPDSIPTSIEGIPLEIQHVNATTTRGDFQFNPTNCAKMVLEGMVGLSEGGTSTISTPFQVTNCAALKFEPKFSVSTSGKTSKANGASLTAKLTYPNVPQGTDADIAKVKVELPKQLPSRLTTLQKACTDKQFETNPAGCPAASDIGYATVHTPLIPVPLQGPVIFVSHGGEAFPSLTMVLQGYGITIDLVGTTFISKAGITSTTFKTVPDQPFSSFVLTLPQGKYSALAANGNLCASKLVMPTEFVAQNGAAIHQSTKIGVTGCAKKKALTRAQKLAAALKVCHKKAKGRKRTGCERQARRKYGPVKRKKK